MDDRPTHRPYARIELERRFLLDALPPALTQSAFERLHDTYVTGTHLRIRHLFQPDGTWITSKLGQKIPNPLAPNDPRQRQMTTIYLPKSEADVLAPLPGLSSMKRRYKISEQRWTFCIDVWEEPARAAGTIVAEVETTTLAELEMIRVPSWALREVTDDPRYSAIALAALR